MLSFLPLWLLILPGFQLLSEFWHFLSVKPFLPALLRGVVLLLFFLPLLLPVVRFLPGQILSVCSVPIDMSLQHPWHSSKQDKLCYNLHHQKIFPGHEVLLRTLHTLLHLSLTGSSVHQQFLYHFAYS